MRILAGVVTSGVELYTVSVFFVEYGRLNGQLGAGDGHEVGRNRRHFIAVAHPRPAAVCRLRSEKNLQYHREPARCRSSTSTCA